MGGWDVDRYGNPEADVGSSEPGSHYDAAMFLARYTQCGAADVARALTGAPSTGMDGDVWRHFDKRRGLGAFTDGRTPPDEQALLYPPVDSGIRRMSDGFGPRHGVHLEWAEYGALVDLHICLDACEPGQSCVVMHMVCEEGESGRLRPRGHAHVAKYTGGFSSVISDLVRLDRPQQPVRETTGNDLSKTPAEADELAKLFGCHVRVMGPGMPADDDRLFGWGKYFAVVSNRVDEVEGVVECRDELGEPTVWLDGLMAVLSTASLREPNSG